MLSASTQSADWVWQSVGRWVRTFSRCPVSSSCPRSRSEAKTSPRRAPVSLRRTELSDNNLSQRKTPKRSKHQADREQHNRFDIIALENVRKRVQPPIRSRSPPTPESQHNRLQLGAKSYERIQQYTIVWRGLRREFYRAIEAGKTQ